MYPYHTLLAASIFIALSSCSPSRSDAQVAESAKADHSAIMAENNGHVKTEAEPSTREAIIDLGEISVAGAIANGAVNDGRYVKLYQTEGRDYFLVDSALVESGNFLFEKTDRQTGLYKLGFGDDAKKLGDVILNHSEGSVKFNYSSDNFLYGAVPQNSIENEALAIYQKLARDHGAEVKGIQRSGQQSKDKRSAIYEADNEFKKEQMKLAGEYSNTFFANMVSHLQSPNRFDKNTYWDDIDFRDVSLIHSPVFPDRIEDYMRIHASTERTEADPQLGFYNAVDQIANKIKTNGSDEVLEFALYTMSEGFYSSGMEPLSMYVVDNYFYGDACGDAEISELFKMKAAGIRNLQIGNTSPDFTLASANGKSVNLEEMASKNELTLVLFWASFCHNCEREIPEIKTIYGKYKSKGLEVIGASVDTDRTAWLKGIETHGTTWPNTFDGEGWRSPVAKDFRVTSTPVMFLLDKDRKVVARPKNAAQLTAYLGQNGMR